MPALEAADSACHSVAMRKVPIGNWMGLAALERSHGQCLHSLVGATKHDEWASANAST